MSNARGGMGFDLGFGASGGRRREEARPLRVVAIGDFGGTAGGGGVGGGGEWEGIRRVVVQPGGIDGAMTKLGVQLEVTFEGERALLRLDGLESMEPDRLAGALPWASKLRLLRRDVQNDVTSEGAVQNAIEMGLIPASDEKQGDSSGGSVNGDGTDAGESGLAGLLGKGVGSGAKGQAGKVDIQDFIRKVVGDGGSGAGGAGGGGAKSARVSEVVRAIDTRLGAMIRAVLEDARFRAIEAAWRGAAHFVIHALDEESVRFEIVHVHGALSADRLKGVLERREEGAPADVVVLVEELELTTKGVDQVSEIAQCVAACGGTVVLSLPPEFVGANTFQGAVDPGTWKRAREGVWRESWEGLRASAGGASIAGVLPRWMARRPYGVWTEPVETFNFEEIEPSALGSGVGHGRICWAGGAWLLARVIAEGWIEEGEGMSPGRPRVTGELPMVTWKDAEGSHAVPPAECWLHEAAISAIGACGGVAVASMRGRDAAVIGPIQSIAGGTLAGRWGA